MTAIVLVSRGTMDTVVHQNLFHGARVEDLRSALVCIRDVLASVARRCDEASNCPQIFAAGFSMGAIILGNYCGRFGGDAIIAGGVAFSGLYDGVANMSFAYSRKTWQAYLVTNLKRSFLYSRYRPLVAARGVDVARASSRRVADIVDWDSEVMAVMFGYKDVYDYYRDLSLAAEDKWRKVDVPLLAVSARDDPITHCDGLRAAEFSKGNPNLLFLITDKGGHVGWPWGFWFPTRGWDFMNEGIVSFIRAIQ